MDRSLRRRTLLRFGGAFAGGLIVEGARPAPRFPLVAAAESFSLNGFTVEEPFASYWLQSGGLAQHGLPLSNRRTEASFVDGQPYAVQYFERAVFERHPEFANTPLQLLGRAAYERRYGPGGAPNQTPNTAPDVVRFRETGKSLGGRFLTYWQQHGGLRQ